MFKLALKIVTRKLKKDKDSYYGWQSNIAVMFQDCYHKDKTKYKNRDTIHKISNEAAKNFLNMLCK